MSKRTSYTHLSQADVALQIESLVEAIEDSNAQAFHLSVDSAGNKLVKKTKLSHYFKVINQMLDLFDGPAKYQYSLDLQAFIEACHDIGLERHPDGPVCLNASGTSYLDHYSSMNRLVVRIRALIEKACTRSALSRRRHEARRQADYTMRYVNALCERYARTTIVRVDYHYKTKAQTRLRVEDVFEDLDRLVQAHRRNPVFEHLIGHIYTVEQGDRLDGSGFHIHAMYLFNGNQVCRDFYKAQQMDKLWQGITQGRGRSYSSNFDKDSFGEQCCIGCVSRNDFRARESLMTVVEYLVKDSQQLRLKPEGARALRKGLLPRS